MSRGMAILFADARMRASLSGALLDNAKCNPCRSYQSIKSRGSIIAIAYAYRRKTVNKGDAKA